MLFNGLSLFALALAGTVSSVTASPEAGVDGSNPALHMLYKRQSTSTTSTSSTTGLTLTGPGPGEVFRAGGTCKVTWSPDTSGASTWKAFTIDLMTGANQNMVKLATLAQNVDGTSTTATSFSWTCPEVKPYSAIYFYQATTDGTTDPQWTTRWTIASADGTTTSPPQSTQPGGDPIPWGTGKLISAAPAVVEGDGSAASSGSATSASSVSASAASSSVESATSAEETSSASVNVPSGVAVVADSSTSSAASASQTSSTSSGAAVQKVSSAATGVFAVVAAAAVIVL